MRKSRFAEPCAHRMCAGSGDFDIGPRPAHPGASASSVAGGGELGVVAWDGHEVAILCSVENGVRRRAHGHACSIQSFYMFC